MVRIKRKCYEVERERTADPEGMKWNVYKKCVREYKRMNKDAKENDPSTRGERLTGSVWEG